jgi:hypothetical protein
VGGYGLFRVGTEHTKVFSCVEIFGWISELGRYHRVGLEPTLITSGCAELGITSRMRMRWPTEAS